MIVLSSGKNIYPEEVETEYAKAPFVKELCVLGVPKERGLKTQDYLYAVIFPDFDLLKSRGEMNIYEVIKNRLEDISKGLPSHQHIMGFMIIKEPLPRTVLGKVKRYEVETRYLPDILRIKSGLRQEPVSPEEDRLLGSEAGKRVIGYLKEAFNIKKRILPTDSIEIDLGIDSLGRTELLAAMESAFLVKLPQSMIAASIFTVKDLVAAIEEAQEKKTPTEIASSTAEPLRMSELIKRPLDAEFIKKIQLKAGLSDKILTFFVKGLIYLFFKIIYGLKVEGGNNIPREGPYIISVNHVTFYDGLIVSASVPFYCAIRLFFMGFRRYFVVPVVRSLVKRGRILPIDAGEIMDAMQAAYFILKHNKGLCIFPEGERSFDGRVQRFKKGVGVIANEIEVKLVPAVIDGAFEVWPRTRSFPKLGGSIRVRFGKPLEAKELLEEGIRCGIKDEAEAVVYAIRKKVIALKEDAFH